MNSIDNGCSSCHYFNIKDRIDHWGEFDSKAKIKTCFIALSYFTVIIPIFMFLKKCYTCNCLRGRIELSKKDASSKTGINSQIPILEQVVVKEPSEALVKRRAENRNTPDKTDSVYSTARLNSQPPIPEQGTINVPTLNVSFSQSIPVVSLLRDVNLLEIEIYDYEGNLTREQKQALTPTLGIGSQQSQIMCSFGKTALIIEKGNLELKDVDVIINSAKETLDGAGGVNKALKNKFGSNYEASCKKFVEMNRGLRAGHACLISVENGKKHVAQAVVPDSRIEKEPQEVKSCLESAVWNSLILAMKTKAKTIAMPALGTGTFEIDKDLVADVLLRAIYRFTKKYPDSGIETIHIVLQDRNAKETTEHFKVYQNVLGLGTPSLSSGGSISTSTSTDLKQPKSFVNVKKRFQQNQTMEVFFKNREHFQISLESQTIRPYDCTSFPSFKKFHPTIKDGNLIMQVHNTQIVIQQADILNKDVQAVINPANEKLIAGSGISLALKNHYGKGYKTRTEAIVKKIGKLGTGSACLMEVGDLKNNSPQFIVHVVAPDLKNDKKSGKDLEENSHLLHSAIFNGLGCVDEQGEIKTMGIPAVGTGSFKFDKEQAARVMIHTLVNYIEQNRNTHLKQININLNEFSQMDIYKNVLGLS